MTTQSMMLIGPSYSAPGDYLCLSVFATIFCCVPTGIAAIIYATQVGIALFITWLCGRERETERDTEREGGEGGGGEKEGEISISYQIFRRNFHVYMRVYILGYINLFLFTCNRDVQ